MRNFIRYFFVLWFTVILVSCQSKPKLSHETMGSGVWQGKVQITDSKKRKSLTGNLIWVSDIENQRLRLDVSAFFGISIATLIMDSGEAWLWLHRERKFYNSERPAELFEKLAKIKIDPEVLFTVLQEEPELKDSWDCKGKSPRVVCNDNAQNLALKIESVGENRKIDLRQKSKRLGFRLVRSKVEVPEKSFHDKSSLGYQQMPL